MFIPVSNTLLREKKCPIPLACATENAVMENSGA
jgi:hypothetical protein